MYKCDLIQVDFKAGKVIGKSILGKDEPISDKLSHFTKAIEAGMTSVVFDARHPYVQVHASLLGQNPITLNWSHLFGRKDFEYDHLGIRGTLSVKGISAYVSLPWDCINTIYHPKDGTHYMAWLTEPQLEELVNVQSNGTKEAAQILAPNIRKRISQALLRKVKDFFDD